MGLRQVTGFTCARCGQRLGPRSQVCADCGPLTLLEIAYDLADVARSLDREALERREPWMWRFRELLPLDELAELPSLQVGMTPVYGAPRLASWLGIGGLWLKDEGRSPSGSVEDRASAMASAQARDAARKVLAVAADGAAAPSLACFAASAGQRAVVFAPAGAAADVLGLAARFGALVLEVDGGLEAARELCAEACAKGRWFDRTAGASPYPFEGKKTVGHEIAEQLSERMPDWIAVAADDDGETLAALARGLTEMREARLCKATPRLLGVTGEGAAALGSALAGRSDDPAWRRAAKAVRDSDGEVVAVALAEADEAARETARRAALLPDALGAHAVAGLKKAIAEGVVERGQTALVLVSGRSREAAAAAPIPVGRELARVEQAVQQAGLS